MFPGPLLCLPPNWLYPSVPLKPFARFSKRTQACPLALHHEYQVASGVEASKQKQILVHKRQGRASQAHAG